MTRIGSVAQNPSAAQDVIGTLDQGAGGGSAAESTGQQGKAFEAFLANMAPHSGGAATADAPKGANGARTPQSLAANDSASATSTPLRVMQGSAAPTNLMSLAAAAARSATTGSTAQLQATAPTPVDIAGAKQAAGKLIAPTTPIPAPLAAAGLLPPGTAASNPTAAASLSTNVAAESASAATAVFAANDPTVAPLRDASAQEPTKAEQGDASSALASNAADAAAAPVLKFAARLAGVAAIKQDSLIGDGSGETTSKPARQARRTDASPSDSSAKPSLPASLSPATSPADANVPQLAAAAAAPLLQAPSNAEGKAAKTEPVAPAQLDPSMQADAASALQTADAASGALPSLAVAPGEASRAAAEPVATAGFDTKIKVVSAATHFAPVSRLSPAQQIADAVAGSVGPMLGMSSGSALPAAAAPTSDAIATAATADPAAVLAQPASGAIKTLNLQLQPDSLGPVTIKLNLSDGGLAVQLEAVHRQTADLIGKDKQAITQSLSDSGYTVASLDVRVAPQHGASLSGDGSAQQGQADPNAGQAGGQASGFGGAPNGDRSTHDAPVLAEPARGSQNPVGADAGLRNAGGGDLFV